MSRLRLSLDDWNALTDAAKDHEFVVDEYLSRRLGDIMQSSQYNPKAKLDDNALAIDPTTRALIVLIETGFMR